MKQAERESNGTARKCSNVVPFKRKGAAPVASKEEQLLALLRGSLLHRDTGEPCTDEEVRAFAHRLAERVAAYRPRGGAQ